MVYIERDLEKKLAENLKNREIIAVVGPRQCGKTTLLRHIFGKLKDAVFLDFEDREALELFVEDEKVFGELYAKRYRYVFIDEFQYAKEGGKKLKYIYDTYPETKIIISGSSAPGLTIESIKYLVGRIFVFNLYPLSFGEFLRYSDKDLFDIFSKKSESIKSFISGNGKMPSVSSALFERVNSFYEEYLIYGGYPRVAISETDKEKAEVLKNIYGTYFLREIRDLLALTTDFGMSKLIRSLSLQVGGVISYNSLQEVSGFDYKSLLKHLNILEKTFICERLQPFYGNRRTELVKAPKIYFFDNGLRNSVINDFRNHGLRQDIGQLNENFIFSQLSGRVAGLNYWRTKSGAEVDFIIEHEGKLIALESKTLGYKRTKSLMSFSEKYMPEKTIVACMNRLEKKDETVFIPLAFVSSLCIES